jgi:hypothetical protein
MRRLTGIYHYGFFLIKGINGAPVAAVTTAYPGPLPLFASIGAFAYHTAGAGGP